MKYRLMLPLTARSKTSNPEGWLAHTVVPDSMNAIADKYPHLELYDMYGPPTPPEIVAEQKALEVKMREAASQYVCGDGRMGDKPWNIVDFVCIELDLETGKATLLKHRPKTTASGFTYAEWYDPENP